MGDDLVKRLRWRHVHPESLYKPVDHLYEEAADRIEALEADKDAMQSALTLEFRKVDALEADLDKAREEGRRAGLEEAARAIADLEDDYGEFAAIVALDRAHKNIRALTKTSTPQEGEE